MNSDDEVVHDEVVAKDTKQRAVAAALRKLGSGGSAGRAREAICDDRTHFQSNSTSTRNKKLRRSDQFDQITPSAVATSRTLFDTSIAEEPEEPLFSSSASPSRSIIQNQELRELISKNSICRHCHGKLDLQFPSYGITTLPTLVCRGKCKIKKRTCAVST